MLGPVYTPFLDPDSTSRTIRRIVFIFPFARFHDPWLARLCHHLSNLLGLYLIVSPPL